MNARRKAQRSEKPLRCSVCPAGADGKGPEFKDARHLTPDQVKKYHKTGVHHRPVVCRACHEAREQQQSEAQAFRCGACPKGADGKGPAFTDVSHLSDSQRRHYLETGQGHRPVVCRACHEKSEAQAFRCGVCPKGADGKAPAFTDVSHLSDSQRRHYFQPRAEGAGGRGEGFLEAPPF